MNIQRYTEEDFNGFVEDLLRLERLDRVQSGIAKYFLEHGYDALSEKQKYVFNKAIEENTVESCNRCVMDIPWCEMIEALDNGGYCNYCQHMMEKSEEEDRRYERIVSASTITIANELTIKDPAPTTAATEDSSINLSYSTLGKIHEAKITEEEINSAYLSSLNSK